jgi:polysaccharide pyruvyl transferase WcaK-like protein
MMHASKLDTLSYFGSRILNKAAPYGINWKTTTNNPTILVTAGFNGNLGDQALLQVSRKACIRSGQQPLAVSYEQAHQRNTSQSLVVMAGGELGDAEHLSKIINLQNNPQLTRIISIAFSNIFLLSPCPKVLTHLRQMTVIHVRDKGNAKAARTILGLDNVTHSPDITFSLYSPKDRSNKLYSGKTPPKDNNKKPLVAVNIVPFLCNFQRNGHFSPSRQLTDSLALSNPGFELDIAISGYIKAIGKLIKYHSEKEHSVVITSFGAADAAFARAILKQIGLSFPIITSAWNYPQMIKFLATCDLHYACRYHAHIAGIIAKVPTIGIVVGKKNQGLLNDIQIDACLSSVDRSEFMQPHHAFDSLLSKQPFTIPEEKLLNLKLAAAQSLDKCYKLN